MWRSGRFRPARSAGHFNNGLGRTLVTAMAKLAAVVMTPVLPRPHGSQWYS
jgi:hypothetical protein